MRWLATLLCIGMAALPAGAPAAAPAAARCAALDSAALAHIADALTAGSDARVLAVALADRDTMRTCGASWRDRTSVDLIAADAADDSHEPAKRCALIAEAGRLASMRDPERARTIAAAARRCR